MKKLLLASDGAFLIHEGYKLLGTPKAKLNIGYVTTASKGVGSREYVERHKAAMTAAGYRFAEIDIEGKTKAKLYAFFRNKNVIHAEGGNTFYLLKAIRESGFDHIIKKLVAGGVAYVGTSAGAYIACPTIETSTWGPKIKDRYGLENLAALNLVPFLLKAHYTDDLKKMLTVKIKQCKYPVRILRDGQGILVNDDTYTFVGEGKEVKL